jgi:gas vesicle protein
MLIWVAVVFLFAACVAWRIKHATDACEHYLRELPPANYLSWQFFYSRGARAKTISTLNIRPQQPVKSKITIGVDKLEGTPLPAVEPMNPAAAAGLDGAIAGLSVLEPVRHIDPSVLAAIEFSTSEHLHNLVSIHEYVHDHLYAAPLQSADGWFERLTGYVAEQKTASALEATGHHVEFAPVANQPVWDLTVDGHHVQVKEGLAGVKDFLASHPGIDVYTSHEAAAASHSPLVRGLDQVDAAHIHEVTSQSLDGVNDALDPGFNFPVITMAFSSWRELKLLVNEMTTIERAIKNVAMDVVGVGGGAWAGSKGLALVGAFIGGPVGAAIGGVVGGILGGISGKMLSTSIRHSVFREARDAYNQAIRRAQADVQNSISISKTKVGNLQIEYQTKFVASRNQIEQQAKNDISRLRNNFRDQMSRFANAFPLRMDDLIAQLYKEEEEVLGRIPKRGIWGYLIPSKNDHYRAAVRIWFQRARRIVEDEKLRFSMMEVRTCEALYGEVQRFLCEYTFELYSLEKGLERLLQGFETARQQAQSIQSQAALEMERERNGLVRELSRKIEEIHAHIVKVVQQWNDTITQRKAELAREGRPLGIRI